MTNDVSTYGAGSRIPGALRPLLISCTLHASILTGLLWGMGEAMAPVSQGDTALPPIEVMLVTTAGVQLYAPEKFPEEALTELAPSADAAPEPEAEPIPEPENIPDPSPEPVTPIAKPAPPEPKTSAKPAPPARVASTIPNGAPLPALQAAELAIAGHRRGEADYFAHISALLEKHKTYPRRARLSGMEGDVTITFTINREGEVLASRLLQSSGYSILDRAALEALSRAMPLPSVPATITGPTLTISVPFGFHLE